VIELLACTPKVAQAVIGLTAIPVRHAPDWPHEDTPDALRPVADHPELAGGTFLVVEDGVVVGDCGWFGPPDEDGEVEIGYGLAPSARGRGVATEAVRLLLDWVRTQGARTVRAEVLPGNEPSWQLLLRLGFEQVGEKAGHHIYLL
jgi:ribosomal-protein-alanine N-acetyltransferase